MNVSNIPPAPNTYANGQKQVQFNPSGAGGQAGQYIYYDEDGKKILSQNKSANGHVGFELDYRKDGTIFSSTITGADNVDKTMIYGSK
ncbi:hypothetical protein [Paraburkholderia rhizosphaerae]|uniref:Uncharacterized protein n=1 Tax=Paraburkholderia rhizosphaerae TaxID=480658 RepID=A0A4V3HEZ1_9BURK|nr:hypothetical protein [Paraburkholderia rhizosphaerae]TDY50841.1 hypothetical protein BX592_10878 [Paraburkholderia rhizosphaerae]